MGPWRRISRGTSGFDVMEIDLHELGAPGSQRRSGSRSRTRRRSAPPPSLDGPRWIYYSSGTTADPKGARHTDCQHHEPRPTRCSNSWDWARPMSIRSLGRSRISVAHPSSPRASAAASTSSSSRPSTPRRRPSGWLVHKPTVLGTAVPFFRAYLDAASQHDDEPLFPSLRFGCFGGAPVPTEIHDEMRATFDVPLVGSWGLTEFPNATSAAPTDAMEIVTTSVGRPASGVSVRAVDANGDVCGTGQEGELLLRGPQCFSGYVDATLERRVDRCRWMVPYRRPRHDRRGRKRPHHGPPQGHHHPERREHLRRRGRGIALPPSRRRRCGRASEYRTNARESGSSPLWCCGTEATSSLTDIREHCRLQGLAVQKCPEQLEVVDAIPRNAMGKVLKQDLRSRLA